MRLPTPKASTSSQAIAYREIFRVFPDLILAYQWKDGEPPAAVHHSLFRASMHDVKNHSLLREQAQGGQVNFFLHIIKKLLSSPKTWKFITKIV